MGLLKKIFGKEENQKLKKISKINKIEIPPKKKPRKLKRIKNSTSSVFFDKHGNLIREQNPKTENVAEKREKIKRENLQKKRFEEEKRAQSFNTQAEPYDFPGDIFKSIKESAIKFRDSVIPIKTVNGAKGKAQMILKLPGKIKIAFLTAFLLIVFLISAISFNVWVSSFSDKENASVLTEDEIAKLNRLLDNSYPSERGLSLRPLPYPAKSAKLDVVSGAAILVDAESGCVLFEKNADTVIPPASITKLFVMYIAFKEIEAGRIHLNDIVPLPEKTWAVNLPRDASLMFLGQGQTVTLDELLCGLAVASGNDAALAVAYFISGSPAAFVERMNGECRRLGLKHTHFVEPSGYDENNQTTARELAEFSRIYVTRFPESIERYHSLKSFAYPLKKNLPAWQQDAGDTKAVKQKNTNPLLGLLDGVDGIKTGFIYESGYNLALTAKGSKEGNAGRIHDGTAMMEWAFNAFYDYRPSGESIYVPALASNGEKFVNLVPAWTTSIPVPHLVGETAKESASQVKIAVNIPPYIYGEVKAGEKYGEIKYKLGDVTLATVPLIAAKNAGKSGLWGRFWGTLAKRKLEQKK